MFKNKICTGVGSRETPEPVLHLMSQIGATLAKYDWTLRSGHAPGADQAFERGAELMGGKMEIYLPWDGFEGAREDRVRYFANFPPNIEEESLRVASLFHPAWDRCSEGAKKMHKRNVHQVAGLDLEVASDLVICWTKNGREVGGTAQAIRMAKYVGIPVFNLAVHTPAHILNYINYKRLP